MYMGLKAFVGVLTKRAEEDDTNLDEYMCEIFLMTYDCKRTGYPNKFHTIGE